MGQLVIEVPQNVKRFYQIKDSEFGERLMRDLDENSTEEKTTKKLETITLDLPYDLDETDENEVLGIWSDSEEEGDEIARRVRKGNRKTR